MAQTIRIFASDIHMGDGRKIPPGKHHYSWLGKAGVKRFSDFLQYVNKRTDVMELIIVGDLLDDWVCPTMLDPQTLQGVVSAATNAPIIKQMQLLCKKLKVTYFRGNHDMGATEGLIRASFPNMVWGQGRCYHNGRLWAEHGNAYTFFNAPDRQNDPVDARPLGYYIARAAATLDYNSGGKIDFIRIVENLLEHPGSTFAQDVFEAVLGAAGLDMDAVIHMPNGKSIVAEAVSKRYANLFDQWVHRIGVVKTIDSIRGDIGNLEPAADDILDHQGANVVLFGHTHKWALPERILHSDSAYGNDGAWCDTAKEFTFIETQKLASGKGRRVEVFQWMGATKNPKSLKRRSVPV